LFCNEKRYIDILAYTDAFCPALTHRIASWQSWLEFSKYNFVLIRAR
jgi:hypothetical protein